MSLSKQLIWEQSKTNNGDNDGVSVIGNGNRLVVHILSAEGNLKENYEVKTGEDLWTLGKNLNELSNDEIVLFVTDFVYELTDAFRHLLEHYGFSYDLFDPLFANENTKKYSMVAGLFNLKVVWKTQNFDA